MSSAARTLLALLSIAESLEALPGWDSQRDRLLTLLQRLEDEGETDEVLTEIDKLRDDIIANARAFDLLREAIEAMGTEEETRSAEDSDNKWIEIPVFYCTDRGWKDDRDPEKRYGSERDDPSFGVATVSVPNSHRIGSLEAPRWWKFERKPNPERHVVLQELDRLARDEFVVTLTGSLAEADSKSVLLYVHGYSVSFANAARRAAQMAYDLKFPGRALLFSWPSQNRTTGYTADEAVVERSRPHFEAFLRLAMCDIGAETVHVIAHSMGNRPLLTALENLEPKELPNAASLHHVVFAAPDVDRDVFLQIAALFPGRAQHLTLYASSNDVALKASQIVHRYPRAGEAGAMLIVHPNLDTIDASAADTSLFGLGHSYYARKRSILNDIHNLILGQSAGVRFDLRPADSNDHWIFQV